MSMCTSASRVIPTRETIAAGTRAAARGGFTTVCAMPNLNPVPDCREALDMQLDIIRRDACVEVLPYASITGKRMGETLVDYGALAPDVAGFSDDGTGVQSEDVMRRAMRGIAATGKVLAAHCEVDSLLRGGYIHRRGLCTAAWSPWHLLRKRMAGSGTRHPACAGNRLPASYLPRLNPRERRAGAPGQGRRSPGNLRDRSPLSCILRR